jgi:hypothetical protein
MVQFRGATHTHTQNYKVSTLPVSFSRRYHPTMSEQQFFSKFSQLPAELQVTIIDHALDAAVKQPGNKLKIHYRLENGSDRSDHKATYCHIRLPSLPALYHVNRFFRAEAIRVQPIRPLFERQERRLRDRHLCGSSVLFDPEQDILEIHFQDKRLPVRTQIRFRYFFRAMSKDIKASLKHLNIVLAYSYYTSCKYELIHNALWHPRFAALSRFTIIIPISGGSYMNTEEPGARSKCDSMRAKFKMMESGDVFEYRGSRERPLWWYTVPEREAAVVENIAEKKRLRDERRRLLDGDSVQ